MKAFFEVTAHWVNNWTLHEYIIDFVDISGISHTGTNLTNMLTKIMEDMGLQKNVLAIVADNVSNNDTLFSNIEPFHIEQVRCFGHVLNLVVQDALGCISESTASLCELIKKIRYSLQRLEMLIRLCSSSGVSQVKPLLDVPTRWSSTYEMLK